MVDPIIVERCAEMSHCEGAVIEIGPGIGSLTEQLAMHAQHVLCLLYTSDDLPEAAFLSVGTIEDVVKKAESLK